MIAALIRDGSAGRGKGRFARRFHASWLIIALAVAVGPGLSSTRVKADEAALDAKSLFAGTCGFCHTNGGRTAGKGPKLAGTQSSDEDILKRIILGKKGRMPAYGHMFTGEQLDAIVAYIRGLEDG